MAASKKTTAVAKKAKAGLVVADYDTTDAGAGFENQSNADISIPFLSLLQSNSPQCDDELGDARMTAGTFYNTVTEENVGSEVVFVPGTTQHRFVEWVPRDQGGGFVAAHATVPEGCQPHPTKKGVLVTPAGNDLIETFYVYGVDEDAVPIVIAFKSTHIKAYKKWNSRIKMHLVGTPEGGKITPPMFANKCVISSVKRENEHGKFFIPEIRGANGSLGDSLLSKDDELFIAAKGIGMLVNDGTATAAHETDSNSTSTSSDGEGAF
jgi:hypothetical protein